MKTCFSSISKSERKEELKRKVALKYFLPQKIKTFSVSTGERDD
jgi:hypothetical protein